MDKSPTTEAHDPSLLGIPTETLEAIASYLPSSSDVASLRLTCRDANDRVLKEFARKTFTDVSVLAYWPGSIGRLEEISKHPEFGKAIKGIVLYTQVLHDEEAEVVRRKSVHRSATGRDSFTGDAIVAHREAMELHRQMKIDQQSFVEKEEHQKTLSRILENIGPHNINGVSIKIDCVPWFESSHSGFNAARRILDCEMVMRSGRRPPSQWMVGIAKAIFESDYRIASLSFLDPVTSVNPQVFAQAANYAKINLNSVVRSLRSFQVHEGPNLELHDEGSTFGPSLESGRSILSLLNHMPELKHLRLERYGQDAAFSADLASAIFLPSLREVELIIDPLTPDQVVAFGKKHIRTLEKVVLPLLYFEDVDECDIEDYDIKNAKKWIIQSVGSDKLVVKYEKDGFMGSDKDSEEDEEAEDDYESEGEEDGYESEETEDDEV